MEKIKKFQIKNRAIITLIFLVSLFLIGIVGHQAFAWDDDSDWYQNFETYNLGAINGQGNWTTIQYGVAQSNVVSSGCHIGNKCLKQTFTSSGHAQAIYNPNSTIESFNSDTLIMYFYEPQFGSYQPGINFYFNDHIGMLFSISLWYGKAYSPSEPSVTYTYNAWHKLQVNIIVGNPYKYSFRIDEGAWSQQRSLPRNNFYTQLMLDCGTGTSSSRYVLFDDIYHHGIPTKFIEPVESAQLYEGMIPFSGTCTEDGTDNYKLWDGNEFIKYVSCNSGIWSTVVDLGGGNHNFKITDLSDNIQDTVNFEVIVPEPPSTWDDDSDWYQNFETYNAGNINGQGNWTKILYGSSEIVDSECHSGNKCLKQTFYSNQAAGASYNPNLTIENFDTDTLIIYFKDLKWDSYPPGITFYFDDNIGNLFYFHFTNGIAYSPPEPNITYALNEWHKLQVKIIKGNPYKYSFRIDDGLWSQQRNLPRNNFYTKIQITSQAGAATKYVWFDDVAFAVNDKIISPGENSTQAEGNINFFGTCQTNGTNNYQLKEGDTIKSTFSCANNVWSTLLNLAEGFHSIDLVYNSIVKDTVNFELVGQIPDISAPNQYESESSTAHISEGGVAPDNSVNLRAWVSDPAGDQVKMQVELRPISENFIGGFTNETGFLPSGSVASITVSDLPEGQYHWQYRAVDEHGKSSDWTEFGTVGNMDFEVVSSMPTYRVAVILAEPSDQSFDSSHNKAYFESIAEQVKDYYCENSFGKWDSAKKTCAYGLIDLSFDIYDNGGLNYKLTQPQVYYGENFSIQEISLGLDGQGRELTLTANDRTEQFVWDAVNQADGDINYNNYQGVIVLFTGNSEEEIMSLQENCLHTQWLAHGFSPAPVNSSGEMINNWMSVSENQTKYAWSHEFGHTLGKILTGSGLCDLYSKAMLCSYGGSAVDYFDLMGFRTSWRNAKDIVSYFSSFTKIKLDWLGERVIGWGNYDLESLETMKFGDEVARYNLPNGSYYLLEARTSNPAYSKWDTDLPGNPLIVYKVSPKEVAGASQTMVNIVDAIGMINFLGYDPPVIDLLDWPYKDVVNKVMIGINNRLYEPESFKISTQVSEYSPVNYIGAILRPQLSLLGKIQPLSPISFMVDNIQRDELQTDAFSHYEKLYLHIFGYKIEQIYQYAGGTPFFSSIMIFWPRLLFFRFALLLLLAAFCLWKISKRVKNEKSADILRIMSKVILWFVIFLAIIFAFSFSVSFAAESAGRLAPTTLGLAYYNDPIYGSFNNETDGAYLRIFGIKVSQIYLYYGSLPFMLLVSLPRLLFVFFVPILLLSGLILYLITKKIKNERAIHIFRAIKKIILWTIIFLSILFAFSFAVSFSFDEAGKMPVGSIPSASPLSLSDSQNTAVDLDLHAYDEQGRHTGINYETGEYENQIPGAEASGDLVYDDEWIFVPQGMQVRYIISSHDIQQYLEANPDIASQLSDISDNYEIQAVYYNEASQRYNSNIVGEQIDPGTDNGHLIIGIGEQTTMTIADKIPPTTAISLSGTYGQNDWFVSDVQVSFSAQDNQDGVGVRKTEYSLDNSQTWQEYAVPFVISAEGIHSLLYRSRDFVGNLESIQSQTIKIDKTLPVISHTSLQSEYVLNSSPAIFDYSAMDEGSGLSSLTATLDGQLIDSGDSINFIQQGKHKIIITAIDNAGNTTTETVEFNVIYAFSGFLNPIKSDGTGLYKQGRTLPTKFRLADSNGQDISAAIAQLFIAKIQDGAVGTDEIPLSASAADTGNLFRYDGQYIYNLSTDTLSIGTWRLKAALNDGKEYMVLISIK